jgi:hypothetical protein
MTILLDEPHIPRFDKTDPSASLEAPFESIALRMLSRLYPSCHAFSFKPLVTHHGIGWRPDVAVIDKNWAYWFVVEIEIATHSLEKHVLPQVRAFRDGDYGEDAAASIAQIIGTSPDHAATLVRYVPRYVAVVSNHEEQEWATQLAAENVQYLSVAGYERVVGPPAYLVTGLLRAAERSVGFGVALPSHQAIRLPRSDFWQTRVYRVVESSGTAEWECVIDKQVVWLTKRRGVVTLPDKAWVQLIAQDDGLLLLRAL